MKPQELKKEYVRLRAEGKSYSTIAKELKIAKSTCVSWEKELESQIADMKRASLEELCEEYGMAKEARIKRIGGTLSLIEDALSKADLSDIDPVKLLDYQLKYAAALKEEYAGAKPVSRFDVGEPDALIKATGNLLERVRAGDISGEQARQESDALTQLLKAYELERVQTELETINAVLGGREP